MGAFIIKLSDDRDYYLIWSSVVDAPVSEGLSLEELRIWYKEEYGNHGMRDLDERLERVKSKGTSSKIHNSAEDTISCNRAGVDGTELTVQQIIDYYCTQKITERPRGKEWWKE
jgi:hypothetical protein